MKNNVILDSNYKIQISQIENELDCLNVKFIICDFGVNKNLFGLTRETIDNWMSTLIHKPVVGKIGKNKDKEDDFTSHNAKRQYRTIDGKLRSFLKFDTDAFGTFYDVSIEEIDGVEHIVATAKIWKRFEKACEIIQDRFDKNEPLATSWEISILKSHTEMINEEEVTWIDDGVFLGHALLSKYVSPAYDSSKMINVAEEDKNEFTEAIMDDLNILNKNEGGIIGMANEEGMDIEVSALTVNDIRVKIKKAVDGMMDKYFWVMKIYPYDFKAILEIDNWDSENEDGCYKEVKYEVSGDNVTIKSITDVEMVFQPKSEIETQISQAKEEVKTEYETKLSEKDSSIVDLGKTIQSQKETIENNKKTIEELNVIKSELDEIKAEKLKEENKQKIEEKKQEVLSTKLFTEKDLEKNTELSQAIAELDNGKIDHIIAQKVIEMNKQQANAEPPQEPKEATSEAKEKGNAKLGLSDESDYGLKENAISNWLKQKK